MAQSRDSVRDLNLQYGRYISFITGTIIAKGGRGITEHFTHQAGEEERKTTADAIDATEIESLLTP